MKDRVLLGWIVCVLLLEAGCRKTAAAPDGSPSSQSAGAAPGTLLDSVTIAATPQEHAQLASYMQAMVAPKAVVPPHSDTTNANANCVTVDASTDEPALSAYNQNAGELWPGAFITYTSLSSGVLTEVPDRRRVPINISVSDAVAPRADPGHPAVALLTHMRVFDVSSAGVTQGMVALMQRQIFTPPSFRVTTHRVYSTEQALFDAGLSASWLGSGVSSSMHSASSVQHTDYLVDLVQPFYTITVDPPSTPVEWFLPTARVTDFPTTVNPTSNPITYINSVTYGRRAMLYVSSTAREEDAGAAINAVATWAAANASGTLTTSQRSTFDQSDVKLWVYGGGWEGIGPDSASGMRTVSLDAADKSGALAALLRPSGKNAVNWGRPLSYRANFLGSNEAAAVQLSTRYQQCKPEPELESVSIVFVGNGDGKDGDSYLHVDLIDAGGTSYAGADRIGDGTEFVNGRLYGPFGLDIVRPLTQSAMNAPLSIRVCMKSRGSDTFRFDFTLAGSSRAKGTYRSGAQKQELSEGS